MCLKGYKVFDYDWTCSPEGNFKQYTCPGDFEEDGELDVCHHGMHFCVNAIDCFHYYTFDCSGSFRMAEVIAYGKIRKDGNKYCTNKLKIVREIPFEEILTMVNIGGECFGFKNVGGKNTGYYNIGNRNIGDENTGSFNIGNWNTGHRNVGNSNSGSDNSGNRNSGYCNKGYYNTGGHNTGDLNTGFWNKGKRNSGCFCTGEPSIMFFNKPSTWTMIDWFNSSAKAVMDTIPEDHVEWIKYENMTDREKEKYQGSRITGGCLRVVNGSEGRQNWWDCLSDEYKNAIRTLPNFDADIFKECTGIDVNKKGE